MAAIIKRLEAWASHSPERTRYLIILLCAILVLFAGGLVALAAWVMLGN
ncbi:MAG: hypothetical protein AB7O80_18875 [Acetobacteraceae bacterium]